MTPHDQHPTTLHRPPDVNDQHDAQCGDYLLQENSYSTLYRSEGFSPRSTRNNLKGTAA